MITPQEKKLCNSITNTLLKTKCSILRLSKDTGYTRKKIRECIRKSIVLDLITDEQTDILIQLVSSYARKYKSYKTADSYDRFIELRIERKKLINKKKFLTVFLESDNVSSNEKDNIKAQIADIDLKIETIESM